MRKYLLRQLWSLFPTLFGISLVAFGLMHLIPGSVIDALLGPDASLSPAERQTLRRILGIDQPLYLQYIHWLGGIFHGDLGVSLATQDPVTSLLVHALPVTVELAILSTLLAIVIAVPLGVLSAVRRKGGSSALLSLLGLLGLSIPNFWLATMLILGVVYYLHWSPQLIFVPLWTDPLANLKQMLLPVVSLSGTTVAVIMRMTRSSMLEVMGNDFIRTARAKGLSGRSVVVGHALKNALIPVVTVIGFQFGYLLGGAVVIEQIFGLPGLGWLLLNSITQRDYPVVQGAVLLITVAFTVVNFAVDLIYARLDPRIAYD